MNYILIDEVSLSADRLRFYFKFDPLVGIVYAAKQQINGEITHIKSDSITTTIAWLGFNDLALALFQSKKFANRFKPSFSTIIQNKLIVISIKFEYHYFVFEAEEWHAYESINENLFLQMDETQQAINSVMGHDFVKNQENHIQAELAINHNFATGLTEMRKFNSDIAEGKFNNVTSEDSGLKIVDINESTCLVIG